MSLLTIIQGVALKVGVDKPNTILGNSDVTVQELLAFANEEGDFLVKRHYWQALRKEQTETTLAAEEQTALPSDFDRFVNETFWNRTRKHRLYGPLSPNQWQKNKSWLTSPVTDSFTVRGNKILINPAPPAGETLAYEYITKNFCQSSVGVEQSSWQADTDLPLLDEGMFYLGTIARFKLAKGLDASADLGKYDTYVNLKIAQEKPYGVVDMSSSGPKIGPNIIVQDGDWNVT